MAELGCIPRNHRDLHFASCCVGHERKPGNDACLSTVNSCECGNTVPTCTKNTWYGLKKYEALCTCSGVHKMELELITLENFFFLHSDRQTEQHQWGQHSPILDERPRSQFYLPQFPYSVQILIYPWFKPGTESYYFSAKPISYWWRVTSWADSWCWWYYSQSHYCSASAMQTAVSYSGI